MQPHPRPATRAGAVLPVVRIGGPLPCAAVGALASPLAVATAAFAATNVDSIIVLNVVFLSGRRSEQGQLGGGVSPSFRLWCISEVSLWISTVSLVFSCSSVCCTVKSCSAFA